MVYIELEQGDKKCLISGADINECLSDNGGCEGICTNYAGSYQCLCPEENTILSADQRSCEGKD